MLWTIRHLWLFGAHFVFNCYRHCSSLVLWNGNGTSSILHSREGTKQGDTLAMTAYRIRILPLIKNIKQEITDVTQPWYADNVGDLGTFARLDTYFLFSDILGTGRGVSLQSDQDRTDCMPKESRGRNDVQGTSRL